MERVIRRFWHILRAQEDGQSVLEFALVLPLFLGLVMALITTALVVYSYILVVNGANQGARVGALEYGIKSANAREKSAEAVEKVLRDGLKPGTYSVAVVNSGDFVSVQVRYNFKVNLPFAEKLLERGSVPVKYTATYKIEKW